VPASKSAPSPRRPSRKRARGEGSIRQRSDGRWEASIRLGPGKPRKYFYGRGQQEVVDKLRSVATQLASGVQVPSDKLTVADYVADWLEHTVKRKNRPTTHEQYRAYAKNHIIPVLGTKSLTKLTPADVEKLMYSVLDRGLSARTAEIARAILRAALTSPSGPSPCAWSGRRS
jgi:integrase